MINNTIIDYLDIKYKHIKGLPIYVYINGYCIFRDEEYWGHANPIEIIYSLVNNDGDEIDSSYKGQIKEDLRKWNKQYGKRSKIKNL